MQHYEQYLTVSGTVMTFQKSTFYPPSEFTCLV